MSYAQLQEQIHRAMLTRTPITPLPVVMLECHDCWGVDPCCPTCHGCGWLRP